MTKNRNPASPTVPPSQSPADAIPLLQRQLERLDDVTALRFDDPGVTAWENTTVNILHSVFGKPNGGPHDNTWEFEHADSGPQFMEMDEQEIQAGFKKRQGHRKALLIAYIEQLTDLAGGPQSLKAKSSSPTERAVGHLLRILPRFHRFARQLLRRHASRPTVEVNDEYDVQDLLHALLKLEFSDVRPEELSPSYAGQSTRMDFLLKDEQVVVEIKKTRKTLTDKELGSELIQDIARYQSHPDCRVLVCFVYDPDGLIRNPAGLKNDLETLAMGGLKVHVVISPAD
jgi:hypothetical protein